MAQRDIEREKLRATVAGTNAVQASTSGNGCTQFFMKAGEQAV